MDLIKMETTDKELFDQVVDFMGHCSLNEFWNEWEDRYFAKYGTVYQN